MKTPQTKTLAAVDQPRLVRLADILFTSIEYGHAKQIEKVLPGFYRQYQAAQKRWEESDGNQDFTVRRHRKPNVKVLPLAGANERKLK